MKNSSQLRSEIAEHREILDSIIATSEAENRDLTTFEAAKAEQIVGRVTEMNTQLEAAKAVEADWQKRKTPEMLDKINSQRRENGEPPIGAGTSSTWSRDSKGRGFCMLSREQKATSLDGLRPVCENAFGHFVLAKAFGVNKSTPREIRMDLSGSDNSLGGFLVPERLSGSIIDLARGKSVLMEAGTRTVVMDSDNLTIPKLEADATVATKAENSAFTASNMTFGARRLNTYTAGSLVKMSRELYEDAGDMVAMQLESFLSSALATQVDAWGLAGTGSAQPLGIFGRGINTTGSIGQPDWADLSTAATAVRVSNHIPECAIMHPSVYGALAEIETGDGTNAARGWLNAPPTLKDTRFLQSTNCPQAKMVIGDFSRYLMGVRTGARVEASTEAGDAFANHQVWLKITMRFDFITLDDTAFELLTGITIA
jgi:HK97 family phage major capsid protein